jgi:quercetin dioxygenase-like cupin family protein
MITINKGWGSELVIHNSPEYCMKILKFKTEGISSMHFHILKTETWYIQSGNFILRKINTDTADVICTNLGPGDVVINKPGEPHQLICLNEGEIFESSTQHFDADSYRVFKGDSQA